MKKKARHASGWLPLVAGLLAALSGCASSGTPQTKPTVQPSTPASHPLLGRIYALRDGRWLDKVALARMAATRRVVLLGEKHDNPAHHRIQAQLLAALIAAGHRPAVVWEMITAEESAALQRYLKRPDATAAGLGAAVRWTARGWPAWDLYRPIAQVALAAKLALIPGGIGRAALMRTAHHSRKASPSTQPSPQTTLPPLPAAARADLAEEIRRSHCGYATAQMVDMMVQVQQLRDAYMAHQLAVAAPHGGAVLIAGNGHVRDDRAVPFYLRRVHRLPARQSLSVGVIEVERGRVTPQAYGLWAQGHPVFDVVWFSERVDEEDPCEQFREQLERMRRKPLGKRE